MGIKTKELGIGIGSGIMGVDKDPYIPVFIEAHACFQKLKVSPYFAFRIGTGIFNTEYYGTKTKGEMYVAGDLGVYFPLGPHGIIIAAGTNSAKFSQQASNYQGRKFTVIGYGGYIGFRF